MASSSQIKDEMLYKLVGASWVPYVRPLSRTAAIMEGHVQIRHGATKKTYKWLCIRCYWDRMFDLIQQTLKICLVCQSHGGPNPQFKHDIPLPDLPFYVVSINLVGTLPTSTLR